MSTHTGRVTRDVPACTSQWMVRSRGKQRQLTRALKKNTTHSVWSCLGREGGGSQGGGRPSHDPGVTPAEGPLAAAAAAAAAAGGGGRIGHDFGVTTPRTTPAPGMPQAPPPALRGVASARLAVVLGLLGSRQPSSGELCGHAPTC